MFLILTKCPIILTKDKDFVKSLKYQRLNRREGEVILLPEDVILIIAKQDEDIAMSYNHPMFIEEGKPEIL